MSPPFDFLRLANRTDDCPMVRLVASAGPRPLPRGVTPFPGPGRQFQVAWPRSPVC